MKRPPRPMANTDGNADPASVDVLATVFPVKIAAALGVADECAGPTELDSDVTVGAAAWELGAVGPRGATGAGAPTVGAVTGGTVAAGGADDAGEDAGGGALKLASTSPVSGGTIPCWEATADAARSV
jgi:hypothetical protein